MYLSYYNLIAKPFQISADPNFLWFGEKHKEALAVLKYGVWDNKGFLLLTGDVGTGKTTLINALVNSIKDKVIVATVSDPCLEKIDFFNYIADAFNIKKVFQSKGSFLVYLKTFLLDAYKKNKKVLLIIDEAQRLNQELLEEIRLLSNIEKQQTKLINIFFVGQNEFNDILLEQRNRAIRQRIALNYNIDPLTERETEKYIKHRLKVSGAQNNIFTSDAIHEIFSYSKGYPRAINIICDFTLLIGYVQEKKKIESDIIEECAKELRITSQISNEPEIEKDAIVEIRDEAVAEISISKKTKGKTAGYIVVLMLLLILGGYFYSPTGFNPYIANIEQFLNQVGINIKNSRSGTPPRQETLIINNENSAGKDLIKSGDQILQEGLVTPQTPKEPEPKIQENGHLNISLSPKEISDLTVLKDRNIGNHLGEGVLDDIAKIEKDDTAKIEKGDIAKIEKDDTAKIEKDDTAKIEKGDTAKIEKDDTAKIEKDDMAKIEKDDMANIEKPLKANTVPPNEAGDLERNTFKSDVQRIITLQDQKLIIYYSYNSNEIPEDGYKTLDQLAASLIQNPDISIVIKGYTDNSGRYLYNQKLSEFRANIVKTYLVGKGVNPQKIKSLGVGPVSKAKSKEYAKGIKSNRRVEIELKKNKITQPEFDD